MCTLDKLDHRVRTGSRANNRAWTLWNQNQHRPASFALSSAVCAEHEASCPAVSRLSSTNWVTGFTVPCEVEWARDGLQPATEPGAGVLRRGGTQRNSCRRPFICRESQTRSFLSGTRRGSCSQSVWIQHLVNVSLFSPQTQRHPPHRPPSRLHHHPDAPPPP